MKNLTSSFTAIAIVLFSTLCLTGCQAIGDIFGAGVYTGIFIVVIFVIIVIVIISKMSKRN